MLNKPQMAAVRQLTERSRYIPEAFMGFVRAHAAADCLFEGLMMSYMDAVASDRSEEWAACGHAIIDVLACGPAVRSTPEIKQ